MYDVAFNAYSLPLMEKLIQTHINTYIYMYIKRQVTNLYLWVGVGLGS